MPTPTQNWYAGHPYNNTTHRGIVWTADTVTLVHDGVAVAHRPTPTPDPYRYWHDLHFLRDFEAVSRWYFGSYWTGRVKVMLPTYAPSPFTAVGTVQYVDDETDPQEWRLDLAPQPVITMLRPPFERSRANLVLVIRTARLILNSITGDVPENKWHLLTSLAPADELADLLSETSQRWILTGQGTQTLRQMWCAAMGLKAEAVQHAG